MLSEGGEENSIYHPFVARFNPIQARGESLGTIPKVSVHNSQSFWDNSLKFGEFS